MNPTYEQVIVVTGTNGHFVNGKWVEEQEPAEPVKTEKAAQAGIETRIAGVTKNVAATIDDAVKVGRELFETDEGRKYVEKSVRDAGTGLQKALQDILAKAQTEMDKAAKKK